MFTRSLPLIALLGMLGAGAATAQSAEATVFAGISQMRNGDIGRFGLGAQEVRLTNGMRVGARLGLNSGLLTGHELSYAFERHDIEIANAAETKARTQQFFYNFVLHLMPKPSAVRPFVTAGVGYTSFSPGGGGIFQDATGENKFGYNYGGGVKLKVSDLFGLRFDVRDHVTGKPNFLELSGVEGRLHSIEYSAGFFLAF